MGEPDHAEILRAQQAERPEHVEVLERAARIDPHQGRDEDVDDPAGIDVRGVEGGLDLHLDAEAARDPRQDRIRLPPSVRHGLQQGGHEAQGGAAPEIGQAEDVEGHEPRPRAPGLPADLPDQVGLADAGRADEDAAQRPVGGFAGLGVEVGGEAGHEPLVRAAGGGRIDPDAVEGPDPVEIDPAQGVEGIGHDWIQRMWKGSPAGLNAAARSAASSDRGSLN